MCGIAWFFFVCEIRQLKFDFIIIIIINELYSIIQVELKIRER